MEQCLKPTAYDYELYKRWLQRGGAVHPDIVAAELREERWLFEEKPQWLDMAEQAKPGETEWDLKHRLRQEGYEPRGRMETNFPFLFSDDVKERIMQKKCRIFLLQGHLYFFVRHGDLSGVEPGA
jgi:hypothetical protein